jgi:hypothetical protein
MFKTNPVPAHDFRLASERTAAFAGMGAAIAAWRKAQAKVTAYEAKHGKAAPTAYYRAVFNAEDRMRMMGI